MKRNNIIIIFLIILLIPVTAKTIFTRWGSPGNDCGEFNGPCGITVDIFKNVYVVDQLNNRIQKFDVHGNFISCWGDKGTDKGTDKKYIAFISVSNAIPIAGMYEGSLNKLTIFTRLLSSVARVFTLSIQ